MLAAAAVPDPATAFKFELYDVRHNWTQYTDVAAKNPVKVQEMKDLMFGEFAKYQRSRRTVAVRSQGSSRGLPLFPGPPIVRISSSYEDFR